MLGIFLLLIVGFSEKYANYSLTNLKTNQDIKIVFNFFILSICFLCISLFYYEKFDYSFFADESFYFLLFFENLVMYLMIHNYNYQNDFRQVAFASLSSLYLIIPISLFYSWFLSLKVNIPSPYENIYESIFFSVWFFLLTIFYFKRKLNINEIKHPYYLLGYALILVNTLFFSFYMIQMYQSFLIYTLVIFTWSLQYYIYLLKKGGNLSDIKEVISDIQERKSFLGYTIFSLISFGLVMIAGKLIAIELIAIFKRIGQLVGSFIIDYQFKGGKGQIGFFEYLMLMSIFLSGCYLMFF